MYGGGLFCVPPQFRSLQNAWQLTAGRSEVIEQVLRYYKLQAPTAITIHQH